MREPNEASTTFPNLSHHSYVNQNRIPKKEEILSCFPKSHTDDEALEFYWRMLPPEAREFFRSTLETFCLSKLVEFWRHHPMDRSVLKDLYDASWHLAFIYVVRNELAMARSLTLNGCCLQECYHSSIEKVSYLVSVWSHGMSLTSTLQQLPYYSAGVAAINSGHDGIYSFLMSVLPSEYKHMIADFFRMKTFTSAVRQDSHGINSLTNSLHAPKTKSIEGAVTLPPGIMSLLPPNTQEIGLAGAEGGTALFGSSSSAASASLQPVFKFNTPSKTKSIEGAITLVIGGDSFQTYPSKPLKTVFNEYANKHSVSLKTLRFLYAGKTLFLSTVGNKSPNELDMIDHDSIEVHPVEVISPTPTNNTLKFQETNNNATQKQKKKARRKSNKRKKGTYKLKFEKSDEEYKEDHSFMLTKLHDEVAPIFKEIRQQLDALLLFKQQPKAKVQSKSLNQAYSHAKFNPVPKGLGGKAGKTHFVLNVGEVNNLYKSTKSNHRVSSTPSTLDLHGCSQTEAISKLNAGLENWNNRAMTGSYPFIHTVSVICGAGGQVLSEVVEKWIKEKPNVCNAPKMKMRRCKFPSVA